MEMSEQQLAERFLCSIGKVNSQRARRGTLEKNEYHRLAQATEMLKEAPIYIDDSAGLTPLLLRAKARRYKSQYNISCIFVDYLQLMDAGLKRYESRQQEITTISRYLKALARELDIPVVVLSQLNRAPEGREDHRPRMSDLRESGSIEQDADVVLLLHREAYYKKKEARDEATDDADDNTAEIIIAKQRNGPTGSVKLVFLEQFTRFENLSFVSEPADAASYASDEEDVPF
jgi:replicative DNA helicase